MRDPAHELCTAIAVTVVTIAMLYRAPWRIAALLVVLFIGALRWLIIIGLLMAMSNMPLTYEVVGATPLSLLLGDQLYLRGRARTARPVRTPAASPRR